MAVLPLDIGYFDVFLFITFFLLTVLWIRQRRPVGFPPGPIPLPIIGNAYNLRNANFIDAMRKLRKQYGDIFSLSLGSFWVIVVNGSENLRELLVKRGEFTVDRPPLYLQTIPDNKGISSASGSPWKHQRTFTITKLREFGFGKRSFETRIKDEIECFCDLLQSYKGKPFDISGIINESMSNSVMSITIGRRFDYDDSKFRYFVKLVNENLTDPVINGPVNFSPFLAKLPGDPFGARRFKQNADKVYDFYRDEIKEHEKTLDENNIRDFIDAYLMEIQKQNPHENEYTHKQLMYILGDLFVAGTETTATTIRWAITYILNNLDIQTKMQKEIEDIVGPGRLPCMSDKESMPYCDAVIQESLRIGKILPFSLPHYLSADIEFKGYKIPKHCVIIPSIDSVSHDENIFPDSNVFMPERFLDADGKIRGQEKVLTFSLGRRVCLGENLARMQLFLYLTTLLQRFEFLPPDGGSAPPLKGDLGLTYSPVPYNLRAISRN